MRKLNEKLFNAYINCYASLSNQTEKKPADEMIKALEEQQILLSVTAKDYNSFYTIARELGVFYQNTAGAFFLGDLAREYLERKISYPDYLKHYVVNTEFLINDIVVHPFSEIVSVLKVGPASLEELVQRCTNCIPPNERGKSAKDKLRLFMDRAIEARLIQGTPQEYSLTKKAASLERAITPSGLTTEQFEALFIGKLNQENLVKKMINKKISAHLLDDDYDDSQPPPERIALNQILYGPPGTGKTYSTIAIALDIIGVKYENYEEAQELFQEELGNRIEFVTMHQSFSYEDFVQGLKPKKGDNGVVEFDYKNGVFKEICRRAEYTQKGDSLAQELSLTNREILKVSFYLSKFNGKKNSEKKANDFLGYDSDNEAFIGMSVQTGHKPNSIKNHRDKFDFMFNDRSGYTARNGWTPRNKNSVLDNTAKWPFQEIYTELNSSGFDELSKQVKKLLEKSTSVEQEVQANQNFVIILDEINRANISRVFGELIALIEEDKRDGRLTTTLPSGESFTVPSNLYIIGTMNTADKSIALVDIALRRRFNFVSMYPNTKELEKVLRSKNLDKKEIKRRVSILTILNQIIRSKKTVDYEIGHSYFMSDDNLENIMNEQVLPLLNEYFMYDLRAVKSLLEKTQKDRDKNSIPKLGVAFDEEEYNTRGLLKIKSIDPLNVSEEIVQDSALEIEDEE